VSEGENRLQQKIVQILFTTFCWPPRGSVEASRRGGAAPGIISVAGRREIIK